MITISPIVPAGPPRDPEAFRRSVTRYLDRAALESQRAMQQEVPKAFSTLWTSIQIIVTGELERLIAPSVNYARMVAEGTGPAAGKKRYFPNPVHLYAWVKQRAGITFKGRKDSPARRRQYDEVRDRAWALARYISVHGTKPNPFHTRAADKVRSRCITLLQQGVHEGLRASSGGAA